MKKNDKVVPITRKRKHQHPKEIKRTLHPEPETGIAKVHRILRKKFSIGFSKHLNKHTYVFFVCPRPGCNETFESFFRISIRSIATCPKCGLEIHANLEIAPPPELIS